MTFDENKLKDPGFFRENRLDPHSDHAVFPAYRLPLNGLWKFAHAVNPAQVIPGFEQPGFDCHSWKDTARRSTAIRNIPGMGWRNCGRGTCRKALTLSPAM